MLFRGFQSIDLYNFQPEWLFQVHINKSNLTGLFGKNYNTFTLLSFSLSFFIFYLHYVLHARLQWIVDSP